MSFKGVAIVVYAYFQTAFTRNDLWWSREVLRNGIISDSFILDSIVLG